MKQEDQLIVELNPQEVGNLVSRVINNGGFFVVNKLTK
jgi:hypothetical protein